MSNVSFEVPKALSGTGSWLDDRFGAARGLRVFMRKVFPDHWSFMLGEIALWSFVILLLTGTFLALFFTPSMATVVYHGSYTKLDGLTMSQAYQSTLNISFDVRGGLLMRQIHHWAADLFMVAILVHMLRVFFSGAYRKPREINWLIGIGLFGLGLLEGLMGYSLPDDQLSGAGLRVLEGILQGIPIVGTYLAFFLFGGPFPGTAIIPRMYLIHVLLLPGLILALVTAHLFIMVHQKHTQMPGQGKTERNVVGQPFFPYFMAKGGTWFFFIFAALALLATFAQINPIWLYGPYSPLAISSASQPDFYMGLLEGSLRIMPAWEWSFLGHTITFSVLIPFAVPLTVVLGGAAFWPFFERWATGDTSFHNVNDRPRNAPVRTATGMAVIAFYAVLWAGRRERRHRGQPVHPAVHDHLDGPGPGVRGAGHRVHRDPAHLPGPAAQGPGRAAARVRVGHHPAAAQRRVRRGAPAGGRGGAGGPRGQAGARAGRRCRLGGADGAAEPGRRARAGHGRPAGPGPGHRQPRLRADHRGAGGRQRARQRPSTERQRARAERRWASAAGKRACGGRVS